MPRCLTTPRSPRPNMYVLLCRPEDLVAAKRAALAAIPPGAGFQVIESEEAPAGVGVLMTREDYRAMVAKQPKK